MSNLAQNIDKTKEHIETLEALRMQYHEQYMEMMQRKRSETENEAATKVFELAENCRLEAKKLREDIGLPTVEAVPESNVRPVSSNRKRMVFEC